MTRHDVIQILQRRIPRPKTRQDQIAAVQALLLVAATQANAMSSQSLDYSSSHVEESANAMCDVLEETFGIELGEE